MHGVDAAPEYALAHALLQDGADQADERRMHGFEPARAPHVPRAAAVLIIEQHDEIGMRGEVVEGTFDQLADGSLRAAVPRG